ncbi:MAG TPA: ABC transporter substrate-binding protein [Chloroflexia bacterium]|nr:ABC transporter substrate-binding protein [Chloroflexia bacterium]
MSKRKTAWSLLVALLLSVLIAACGDNATSTPASSSTAAGSTAAGQSATTAASGANQAPAKRGGDLKIAIPQLPSALDPVISTLGTNWTVAANACEGLFALDDNWNVQPMLVDSYTYDAATPSLTFKLRQGVKFQDDSTMTADDVVASLTRYSQSAGTGAILKSLMKDIKATDPNTVVLTLTQPTGTVPALLTMTPAVIMPKKNIEGVSASTPVQNLICTGPYKVTDFKPDQQAVLTRFDGYVSRTEPTSGSAGAKTAPADRIIFLPQAEPSTRRDSLLTGSVDVAAGLPFDFYDAIKSNSSVKPLIIKDNQSLTMVFNTKQGPTANVKLRQAIYYALDMDPIMLAAEGNPDFYSLDPSWYPFPGAAWHTNVGAENFGKANLDKAKQLLKESGYNGETLRWLTSKDYFNQWYLPAQTVQQQLEKIGIKIDLQALPAATVSQKRTDPANFEIFSSFLPAYPDPTLIPYLQSTFPGFWSNQQKEDLVTKLRTESDQTKRVEIWKQIQTLLYQEFPYIKFGTEAAFSAVGKNVTGLSTSPANTAAFYNVSPGK